MSTKAEQGNVDLSKFNESKLEELEDKYSTNGKQEVKEGGSSEPITNEAPSQQELLAPPEPEKPPALKRTQRVWKIGRAFKGIKDFRKYMVSDRPKTRKYKSEHFP